MSNIKDTNSRKTTTKSTTSKSSAKSNVPENKDTKKTTSKAVKNDAKNTNTSTGKTTNKQIKNHSNPNTRVLRKEILGVLLIAFSIFLMFVVNQDGQIGIVGDWIKILLISVFGKGMFFLPFVILLIGVLQLLNIIMYSEKKQIISICGIFICILMLMSIPDFNLNMHFSFDQAFNEMLDSTMNLPKNSVLGGGILGNVLSFIFVKLMGIPGTYILISAVILIFVIIFTNQSLIGFFKLIFKSIRKFFKSVYNFIYVEVDEKQDNTENKKPIKQKLAADVVDENINVFDYNNEVNSMKSNLITQLKIDDIKIEKTSKNNRVSNQDSSPELIINELELNSKSQYNNTSSIDSEYSTNIETKKPKLNKITAVNLPIKDESIFNVKDHHSNISETSADIVDNTVEAKALELKKQVKEDLPSDIIIVDNSEETNMPPVQEYILPDASLLNDPSPKTTSVKEDLRKDAEKLLETLQNFNIQCTITQISRGPSITRYELQPAPGIKVSRITGLQNDIALSLASSDIRMEAPIPGKAAIGIEVPNKEKTAVMFKSLIESEEFKNSKTKVPVALGKDIAGKNIIGNIATMPHLLVAGATGAGKSVCINTLIMSILFSAKPDEVKLILIDPKVVELNVYNGIPHLLIPVVTDPRKASNALNWAVSEMTTRYKVFAQNSVRDLFSFNEKMVKDDRAQDKMPQIVIIIDELADLMQVAPGEVEECITRIAQLARACGIHLVIATQRPSVDIITGVIKANIPSRIAFAVSSYIDSRTILDSSGAEKLLGKGDMLFHPIGQPKPTRVQGTFISDDEIKRVVDYIVDQKIQQKANSINAEIEKTTAKSNEKVDELLEQAIETVVIEGQASASYLQRRFSIGYNRAARLIDSLEERGIISGYEGSKPRKVLLSVEEYEAMKE